METFVCFLKKIELLNLLIPVLMLGMVLLIDFSELRVELVLCRFWPGVWS